MSKSSRQRSSQKQSKHSSNDAADYSDSEAEIEIVVEEEEEDEARTKKYRNGKEESSVRVSRDSCTAGEKRRLCDRDDNRSRRGNGSEDSAKVEHSASKRRRDSERKDTKEKVPELQRGMEDTGRPLQDEVRRNPELKEVEKQSRRSRDVSVEKGKYQDCVRDDSASLPSSRGKHTKDRRYKDSASYKDKYGEDVDRDSRHRDSKSREDVDWKKRRREERHKDEHALRDHPGDRLGTKYTRDEGNAVESGYKKSRYEISNYDDGQNTRYNDDRGKRADDKVDQSYGRSRSTKEQHSDAEKKVAASCMVESAADKEGSRLRCVDADFNASYNRQRSSPSSFSHLSIDQYRCSTQAELKYGNSEPEERVRQNLLLFKEVADVSGVPEQPSLSKPAKRLIERCLNPDACTSPVHPVDDSKLNRVGIRGSFDSKESGKSSDVIKDTDSSGTEGKGSWQVPLETPPTDELTQEDSNDFSSSPSSKAGQMPSNSQSNFPPPHHRYKRINSSSVGRGYGNARKGVPNRPSPQMNSFIHFHHGPAPVVYHPVMHPFSAFPMYGVRPMMDITHSVFPHHITDDDRFLSHGCPFGWQNSVDDSCPPPLHGWDANNGVTRREALANGMFHWNHNREPIGGQQLETSADMWKGPHGGVNPELPSVSQEEDPAVHAQEAELLLGVSNLQAQNKLNQCDVLVDKSHKIEIGHNSDALAKEPSKLSKSIAEKLPELSKIPKDDDDHLWLVYLSKLDISAELTHPELYNQCLRLTDVEQNESVDEDSLKLLYLEEIVKTQAEPSKLASSASLFVAINESVFQRAMSFYKKQREETRAEKLDCVPVCDQEKEAVPFYLPLMPNRGAVSSNLFCSLREGR